MTYIPKQVTQKKRLLWALSKGKRDERVFSEKSLMKPAVSYFWRPQSALGFPLKEDLHTTLLSCLPHFSLNGFGTISHENTH